MKNSPLNTAHRSEVTPDTVHVEGRARIGGGHCPTCRACADHGIPHLCITRGGSLERLAIDLPRPALTQLLQDLRAHPALHEPETPGGDLKPVSKSWCVCGCGKGT